MRENKVKNKKEKTKLKYWREVSFASERHNNIKYNEMLSEGNIIKHTHTYTQQEVFKKKLIEILDGCKCHLS